MESQRETSVCCQPKSPEGRKKRILQTGHSWSQKAPPPPISSVARIKSTHGSTRLCIISTQKQTLGLTIGASEPVLTLSPGNHGKAAQGEKASASVSCLKGEWDDIPSRASHPRQAALWSHHSPDQWLSGLKQPPQERENSVRRSCRLQWAGGPLALWSFTPASEEAEGKVISYPPLTASHKQQPPPRKGATFLMEIRHSIHILQYTSVTYSVLCLYSQWTLQLNCLGVGNIAKIFYFICITELWKLFFSHHRIKRLCGFLSHNSK